MVLIQQFCSGKWRMSNRSASKPGEAKVVPKCYGYDGDDDDDDDD